MRKRLSFIPVNPKQGRPCVFVYIHDESINAQEAKSKHDDGGNEHQPMVVATLLCEERVSLERALNVVKSDNENLGKKDRLILELVMLV